MLFFKKMFFFGKKKGTNEFGESPNSLQTQKNMRFTTFFTVLFEWLNAYVFQKKSCETHIFSSLERVWRFSKLIFSPFFQKTHVFF